MEQQRVQLANGIELDVVDVGPRDAPVLMFLHGFPESHRTWRHQIAHFSDRFRCIAPDQRGYRGSSKPQAVESYTPDKLTGDVFALADALGVEKFTIVGHDWGGAIAWIVAYWGQANGRVTRTIIANAPHPAIFQRLLYLDPKQRESSQYMRVFTDTANDDLVREHGLAAILMKAFAGNTPTKMAPEARDALMQDWQNRDAAFGMLNYYRASSIDVPAMDAPFELPEGWAPPPLPKLTMPTLVIWGVDDFALPIQNTVGMDQLIEDLTLVELPGCGHFVTWEAPDAMNAAMEEFLAHTG